MNKYTYTVGSLALALAIGGLPAFVLAERGAEGSEVSAQVGVSSLERVSESLREEQEDQLEASSSVKIRGEERDEQDIDLEDDEDRAFSFDDLKQRIESRRQKLADEEASTTPKFKNAMKNANEVRLAVHALLASRDLIGGIGQQVSEIAKSMNDSVASTTNAEAKVHSRGFLTRFLFGGDKTSAEVIAQEAARNQSRIDSLTTLLAQSNVSADVQAILNAQITAIKEAQTRLQAVAEREQKSWGLFSWRF